MVSRKELATLNVALRMDTAQFKKQANGVKKEVKTTADQMKRMSDSVVSSFKAMAAGLVAGGVVGILGKIKQEMNEIEEIGRRGEARGLSIEFVSRLRTIAASADVDLEQLLKTYDKLAIKVGDPNMAKFFSQMGLNAGALSAMDPITRMTAVLEAVSRMENRAQRHILFRMFEEEGSLAIMKMMRDYGSEWQDDMQGITGYTTEMLENIKLFNDQWIKFFAEFKSFAASALLPALEQLNKFNQWYNKPRSEMGFLENMARSAVTPPAMSAQQGTEFLRTEAGGRRSAPSIFETRTLELQRRMVQILEGERDAADFVVDF